MRESPQAKQAYADYLALGPGRTLSALQAEYLSRTEAVPTRQLSRLKFWSSEFDWQDRLSAIADAEAKAAEDREAAYRRAIMETGYALPHERIQALKELADALKHELTAEGEENRRWVRDVKQIGSGDTAERVDIERFNAAELEQFRGLLDDIAKELGDRKEQVQHGGTVGLRMLIGVDVDSI